MSFTSIRQMKTAALDYAAFEKSDPFAYSRAISHIQNGICNPKRTDDEIIAAHYSAVPFQEERELPNGEKYTVTAYKNAVRP